jgi:hypothetical protein
MAHAGDDLSPCAPFTRAGSGGRGSRLRMAVVACQVPKVSRWRSQRALQVDRGGKRERLMKPDRTTIKRTTMFFVLSVMFGSAALSIVSCYWREDMPNPPRRSAQQVGQASLASAELARATDDQVLGGGACGSCSDEILACLSAAAGCAPCAACGSDPITCFGCAACPDAAHHCGCATSSCLCGDPPATCYFSWQCCGTAQCQSDHTCRPAPPPCSQRGQDCRSGPPCCSGLVCEHSSATCRDPQLDCSSEGEDCTYGLSCCSSLTCRSGQCDVAEQCLPRYADCYRTPPYYCCDDMFCNDLGGYPPQAECCHDASDCHESQ